MFLIWKHRKRKHNKKISCSLNCHKAQGSLGLFTRSPLKSRFSNQRDPSFFPPTNESVSHSIFRSINGTSLSLSLSSFSFFLLLFLSTFVKFLIRVRKCLGGMKKNVHLIEEFGNFEQIRIRCIGKCCRRRRCQRLLRRTYDFSQKISELHIKHFSEIVEKKTEGKPLNVNVVNKSMRGLFDCQVNYALSKLSIEGSNFRRIVVTRLSEHFTM